MTRMKIRIEVEREPDPACPNRSYNYDEVYSQTVDLADTEPLTSSVIEQVVKFMMLEFNTKTGDSI